MSNLSWNYICSAVEFGTYFLLTPYIVKFLGGTVYGIWILVKTIMFCLRFLNFSVFGSTIKYISEYSEARDIEKENKVIGIALNLSLVTGLLALAGSALAAFLVVPNYFSLPVGSIGDAKVAVLCFGFMLLFEFPGTVIAGVFGGRQRFDVTGIFFIARTCLVAVITFFLLHSGYGFVSIVLVEVVFTILDMMLLAVVLNRMFPEICLRVHRMKGEIWRKFRDFSFWNTVNNQLLEGVVEIHKLLIPVLLPVAMVTSYSIMCTIASGILLLVEPASFSFLPFSSANNASGRNDRQNDLLIRGTKYVAGISLVVATAITFYGEAFIKQWLGSDSIEIPFGALHMVVASFAITAFMSTAVTILRALDKVRQVFWMSFCQFAVSLLLIFVMTPRYGLRGFAAGVLAANIAVTLFWKMPYVCRLLNESMKTFLLHGLIKPLLPLVPVVALVPWLDGVVDSGTLPKVLIKCVAVSAVYLAGFCALSMSGTERREARRHVAGLVA